MLRDAPNLASSAGSEGSTSALTVTLACIRYTWPGLAHGQCWVLLPSCGRVSLPQVAAAVAWTKRFVEPMNRSEQALYVVKYKKHMQALADAAAAAKAAEEAAAAAAGV